MIDITENEEKLVIERYKDLKKERAKYINRWRDIQDYVAITNEVNADFQDTRTPNKQKDVYINDPTTYICVNQAGDYLAGILWGLSSLTLEPSEDIEKEKTGNLSEFYKMATEITLSQMNSPDAGFQPVLRGVCYDQYSFGTSGIGTFLNQDYLNKQSDCCLTFKPFGVWNTCIDEGANNKIDIVFTVYNWRLNQVIEEFCYKNGTFKKELFNNLPEEIKSAYENNDLNKKFKIIFGVMPNNFYIMGKRGKAGAKYKGYWFIEQGQKRVFKTEYFTKIPIAMGRAIKVNNQIYGESAGSLSISSIKMLNHIAGKTIDNIEKTNDSPLGIISGALASGGVLNRSAGAVNIFNPQAQAQGQNPIFPIGTTGDISSTVNFLMPEIKKDIVNMFKLDQLLDFNNQTQMTATESSYRMSIRGKAIAGLLSQMKTEIIEPVCHRAISLIQEARLYGEALDELPEQTEEEIEYKQKVIKEGKFIPDVVYERIKENKPWYKLKFNGELEKLSNAETYESIGRFLQYFSSLLQIKPEIQAAINDYEFLDLVKKVSNLTNDKLIKNKYDYEAAIEEMKKAQQQQQEQQIALMQSQMLKNMGGKDLVQQNEG